MGGVREGCVELEKELICDANSFSTLNQPF